ncbi:MAG TPA: hypothetical protein VFZ89_12650, partial [Solirubrobacteraceae bacterium]
MLAVDVHQHLWPDTLLRALERRTSPPFARRRDGAWQVALAHEPAFAVTEDVAARVASVRRSGIDRALVALSSPVGIEALPPRDADPLLLAWQQALATLPPQLEGWAALPLHDPDPARVRAALDAGAAGLCLPAAALASPSALERIGPVLELLEHRLAPLFVHPGAAHADAPAAWWAPVTDYVAQLHAAWHAFTAWGRPAHPRLRVVFAALAGLAPLHAERTAARGGPTAAEPDPLIFYEPSSYGARALRAMAAAVGVAQLVHGTDEPVIGAPSTRPLGDDVHDLMRTSNAARLL